MVTRFSLFNEDIRDFQAENTINNIGQKHIIHSMGCLQFWFASIVNLCKHFFAISEKRPKSKKCLSLDYSGILSVYRRCLCPRSCLHQLICRGLEYLLKLRYNIVVDTNGVEFLILDHFPGQDDNTALCLKKYHTNLWHLS